MDKPNGDSGIKNGRSEDRINVQETSLLALSGLAGNPMSFGSAAQLQFPAAMSNSLFNNPQEIITTNLRTSNCQNPMTGSISFPVSASDEGATSQTNAPTITLHPSKKRTLEEVTEDNILLPRSTLCSDSSKCADTDLLPLNADNSGNEETASKGSKNNSDTADSELPNSAGNSSMEQDVAASNEGIQFYSVNDVLCGRGGGTNVHPGNRRFRDLVNANRRAYLKAKKNDKPTISRSIVQAIRQMNGRFLKKDDAKDLWFEIGDDSAREKTSQALRQRAPEMRKILHEDEQRRQQLQHQQQAEHQMMINRQLLALARGGGIGGNYTQMNALAGIGHSFNPSSMMSNPLMGQGGNVINPDLSQSLLANYSNILQQKNWLAQQEQNMIFQRLSMAGINPHSMNNAPSQNHLNSSVATEALFQQSFNPVVTRGAWLPQSSPSGSPQHHENEKR